MYCYAAFTRTTNNLIHLMKHKYNIGDEIEVTSGAQYLIISKAEETYFTKNLKTGLIGTVYMGNITKLIKAADPVFELGEEVEVKFDSDEWAKRVYAFTKNSIFYCVDKDQVKNLGDINYSIRLSPWKHIRKIEEPTIKITVEVNGKAVSLNKLSMETIANIRDNE